MQIKLIFMILLLMLPGVHADDDDADKIGDAIVDGISGLIRGVFELIEDYIIEPGMRIFRNVFGGIADAFGAVIGGTFHGVTGYMDSAWNHSIDSIRELPYIGPFAPLIAFAILGGVVFMFYFLFFDKVADDLVPIPGEDDMED